MGNDRKTDSLLSIFLDARCVQCIKQPRESLKQKETFDEISHLLVCFVPRRSVRAFNAMYRIGPQPIVNEDTRSVASMPSRSILSLDMHLGWVRQSINGGGIYIRAPGLNITTAPSPATRQATPAGLGLFRQRRTGPGDRGTDGAGHPRRAGDEHRVKSPGATGLGGALGTVRA